MQIRQINLSQTNRGVQKVSRAQAFVSYTASTVQHNLHYHEEGQPSSLLPRAPLVPEPACVGVSTRLGSET